MTDLADPPDMTTEETAEETADQAAAPSRGLLPIRSLLPYEHWLRVATTSAPMGSENEQPYARWIHQSGVRGWCVLWAENQLQAHQRLAERLLVRPVDSADPHEAIQLATGEERPTSPWQGLLSSTKRMRAAYSVWGWGQLEALDEGELLALVTYGERLGGGELARLAAERLAGLAPPSPALASPSPPRRASVVELVADRDELVCVTPGGSVPLEDGMQWVRIAPLGEAVAPALHGYYAGRASDGMHWVVVDAPSAASAAFTQVGYVRTPETLVREFALVPRAYLPCGDDGGPEPWRVHLQYLGMALASPETSAAKVPAPERALVQVPPPSPEAFDQVVGMYHAGTSRWARLRPRAAPTDPSDTPYVHGAGPGLWLVVKAPSIARAREAAAAFVWNSARLASRYAIEVHGLTPEEREGLDAWGPTLAAAGVPFASELPPVVEPQMPPVELPPVERRLDAWGPALAAAGVPSASELPPVVEPPPVPRGREPDPSPALSPMAEALRAVEAAGTALAADLAATRALLVSTEEALGEAQRDGARWRLQAEARAAELTALRVTLARLGAG